VTRRARLLRFIAIALPVTALAIALFEYLKAVLR